MKTLFVSSAFLSYMASLSVHIAVLLGTGWSMWQKVEYGVRESSSGIQIDLIAANRVDMPDISESSVSKSTFEKLPEPEVPSEKEITSDASDFTTTELIKPEKARYRPSPSRDAKAPYSPSCNYGRSTASVQSDHGAIVRVNPEYLKNPPPRYPELSRQKRQEGVVTLLIIVSKAGEPLEIKVGNSSGYALLDQSAKEAVARWRFKPANIGGIHVVSQVEVPVRFELN